MLGRAGCGELKTSPAAASLGQGLVVLGGLNGVLGWGGGGALGAGVGKSGLLVP